MAGDVAPLGNTAKSASIARDMARLDRFRNQSQARRLSPLQNRIQGCLRWPTGGVNARIAVKYRAREQYAYYGGLQTCGSVWRCPVCANKITERRRMLWRQALGAKVVVRSGGEGNQTIKSISMTHDMAMASFTIQHKQTDKLAQVLYRLERAYSLLWSGRWAKQYKSDGGVMGTIRALEITHGENGWHPHIHTVFVLENDDMRHAHMYFSNNLKQRWGISAMKAGGHASYAAGVDFRHADLDVMNYVDKLGVDTVYHKRSDGLTTEVTRYPTKQSRSGGDSLTTLLGKAADGQDIAGANWQVAQANLIGKRHIVTSKGLLRKLGASQELSDDRLAATDIHEAGDEVLALIEKPQWDIIDSKNLRGDLLNVASTGSREAVLDFIAEVTN